jgi:hypothetical protein
LRSQPTLLFISPLADISPPHAEWLADTNGTTSLGVLSRQDGTKAFDLYRLADGTSSLPERLAQVSQWPIFLGSDADFPSGELADWGIPFGFPVNFGDTLQLIGLEVPRQEIYSEYDGVNIQLYFQPLIQQQNLPLNVFVHLLRPDGTVAAQRDLLGVPSASWHPEIIFIQDNFVVAGSLDPGRYFLTMGVYNWQNGQRLSVLDESGEYLADKIMITQIDVVPRE